MKHIVIIGLSALSLAGTAAWAAPGPEDRGNAPTHEQGSRHPDATGSSHKDQGGDASAKHGNANYPERPETQHNHGGTSGGPRN